MNRFSYHFFYKLAHIDTHHFLTSFLDRLLLMLLLFSPVFALWLRLLYIRKSNIYVLDHLLFILYNHAFFALLIFIGIWTEFLVNFDAMGMLVIFYAVYLFIAFKRFYGQGKGKTMLKYILSGIGFLFMASIFILLNSALAVLFA